MVGEGYQSLREATILGILPPVGRQDDIVVAEKSSLQTPFIAGSQTNLWICRLSRASRPSASIHSTNTRGSRRQFSAVRIGDGVLVKAGEKSTEPTFCSRPCSRTNSRANS